MVEVRTRKLKVKVQARSSRPGIEEIGPDDFKVRVASPPEKGRANREVIRLLSDHLRLPPSRLVISSGRSSRSKIIEIRS